jgi:guanylate kinase
MFWHKKRAGHFLETEKVFGYYYGTPNALVKRMLGRGKSVLLCIDVKGTQSVLKKFPHAATIFVKTPSLYVLRHRLRKRGSETKQDFHKRLNRAIKEMNEAHKYKYILINDNIKKTYTRLFRIVLDEIVAQNN